MRGDGHPDLGALEPEHQLGALRVVSPVGDLPTAAPAADPVGGAGGGLPLLTGEGEAHQIGAGGEPQAARDPGLGLEGEGEGLAGDEPDLLELVAGRLAILAEAR